MRQIVLDTETTGLSAAAGHRIIEIGCIELLDRQVTERTFHYYLNPDRAIDEGAKAVHGISSEFLQDKPRFAEIVDAFLDFVKEAELIIHNAPFDMGFLDAELKRLSHRPASMRRYCEVIDTLTLARKCHPGQQNNLDALCKRYHIANQHREWHGALLDAELLAQVYLIMTGGQASLFGDEESTPSLMTQERTKQENLTETVVETRVIQANEEEVRAHVALTDKLLANKKAKGGE